MIVVEHDEETIRAADHIIDIGPGRRRARRRDRGRGDIDELLAEPRSITGQYLSGERTIAVPVEPPQSPGDPGSPCGRDEHNLKNVDVRFPLGVFVGVTGVIGSARARSSATCSFRR